MTLNDPTRLLRSAESGLAFALVLLALVAAACSDPVLSSTLPPDDVDAAEDLPGSETGRPDRDLNADFGVDDAADQPTGGGLLDPCTGDDDCVSGFCVQYQDGNVCTELCAEDTCPDGWSCRTLSNTGADAVRLCIPNPDSLCRLCSANTDCSNLDDMCISSGGQNVCGQDCSDGSECPFGFVCDSVTDLNGNPGRQCVSLTGSCSCAANQIGESRACVSYSAFGVCAGLEVCQGDAGWSPCSAPQPIAEICDGIDNDCDGQTDEGLTPRPCFSPPVGSFGTCEGTETCMGTAGWVCNAPTPSIEICDRLDNDCNGLVDDGLCFDGNSCTTDTCDPLTGACSFVPAAGACDDMDACTTGDVCVSGVCRGTPRSCDDGNACTSDRCDAATGCVSTNLDGAPCEIGNFCTDDVCRAGACTRGPATNCGSATACLSPSCDPEVGCTTERLTGGPCDDDDACTVNDRCSNGICIGGTPACAGPCPDCPGRDWITSGGTCVELFGAPVCACLCL
jgi:hypothetical protein